MTRNEFKNEAKWAIIEKLEEGYDGYLCDLHNEVYFEIMDSIDGNVWEMIFDKITR